MKIKNNAISTARLLLVSLVLVFAATIIANAQVADYRTDDHLSPQVKEFLKTLNTGGPGLETLSPIQARGVLSGAQTSSKFDYSSITETSKTIKAAGSNIRLDIARPKGVKGLLPVFIFIHGGGWVLGDYPTHRRMVRDLVTGSGAACVFINYTRTPDAKYPTAINEIYDATSWVAKHGQEIGVNGKKLAIIGNSVGGNMTAVTSILAKERKGPEIRVAILLWPIVDADFNTPSYQQFGSDRFLTTPLMKWMYDMYIPEPAKRQEAYASPLHASESQLKGFPPTLILVAENDVLRDEGEAFGRKLLSAGVEATTVRYNGVIHDWGLLNGLANLPQTKDMFIQASSQLKKYLFK